jgi:hypothetical protein
MLRLPSDCSASAALEAPPERKLAVSGVPALLIPGLEDRNIPKRHSERILAFAGQGAQLWGVAGAGHTSAVRAGSSEFEQRVLGWFSTHSRRSGQAHLSL